MRCAAFGLAVALLGGCATLDRPAMSEFRPVEHDAFTYRADAGALGYEADSESAEQMRMDWLQQWLALNDMCPEGYAITARQVVATSSFGAARIYYAGRCT